MRKIDGKYHIEGEMILNTKTRDPIPLNEPLFLLRARDHHAFGTIEDYADRCQKDCGPNHLAGIAEQREEFDIFRRAHPERMKEPGSSLHRKGRAPEDLTAVEELLKKDWEVIRSILNRLGGVDKKIEALRAALQALAESKAQKGKRKAARRG